MIVSLAELQRWDHKLQVNYMDRFKFHPCISSCISGFVFYFLLSLYLNDVIVNNYYYFFFNLGNMYFSLSGMQFNLQPLFAI